MKKVLIITYYWPPTGGSGVQRWLKTAKYLRKTGWEPVIYTPENPEGGSEDRSLLKDVPDDIEIVKTPIFEPFDIYKKFTGRKKGEMIGTGFLSEKETPSIAEKLSVWIRGNFFIPDARKFWIKPSVKFLKKYLKSHPADVLVSTGPPHSMHLIARALKRETGIPWVADFRDPWTGIDFYRQLMLTAIADRKHHLLEKSVLLEADRVVTVNPNLASHLEKISGRSIDVVTNGYDPDDYRFMNNPPRPEGFSFCHLGSMNKDRNHEIFWKTLGELSREIPGLGKELSLLLIGATDIAARRMIDRYGLAEKVSYIPFMEHQAALERAAASQILYLPLNNTPNAAGITPTKLFEYLALERPILCIGPTNGDAAHILNETESGMIVGFDDRDKLKETVKNLFDEYRKNKIITVNKGKSANYSRPVLTGKMSRLFEIVTR